MRLKRKVRRYMESLADNHMEPREVMRAGLYANVYGLDSLRTTNAKHCVEFAQPTGDDWDCLHPAHQRTVVVES